MDQWSVLTASQRVRDSHAAAATADEPRCRIHRVGNFALECVCLEIFRGHIMARRPTSNTRLAKVLGKKMIFYEVLSFILYGYRNDSNHYQHQQHQHSYNNCYFLII